MRRLLVIFALALLAASCSSSDVLATVNGVDITKDELLRVDPGWEDPRSYTPTESARTIGGENVNLASADSVGGALRQSVVQLVTFEATVQAAETQFGVFADEEAIAARLQDPPRRYASLIDPAFMADGANDDVRRRNAEMTILQDEITPMLIADQLGGYDAWLADRPETVSSVCLRFIVVATAEDGDVVVDRLETGDDFAVVAEETSLDQSAPGGYLLNPDGSCGATEFALVTQNQVVGLAVMAAEVGQPAGPIDIGGSFVVLMVEERIEPSSAADLQANAMEYVDLSVASTIWAGWSSQVVAEADVEVSPQLGTWSAAGLGIVPPSS